MRELIRCWQHTRMIVLIALCAALYVAVLLPFKIASIVPGITEIRPAAALPIVFSIFFGPAAAWGTAFGNLIGDVLGGTIGPGSFFGVLGNFVYGFVPYRLARTYLDPDEELFSVKGWLIFLFSLFLSGGLCATIIALGVDFLKIVAFDFLVTTIFLNNFLVSLLLAPILIRTLAKRVKLMGLEYSQLLEPHEISTPLLRHGGSLLTLVALLFVCLVMMIPSFMSAVPFAAENPKTFELVSSIVLALIAVILL